ncbi:protein NRT1/ PTR FAMILY 1.2-like isoform X1 [Solanum dulcamara]|uniref:protein NRT1/ PTR FAMILY 1.2-like isoform X1 n=1 Tax=Solanum dulcamara TaxID=45834 RepID=UPI0024859050|nr:protein NRT1/ PTR FAMILY 1.2-like isoform X1 [Solanum dulcamara]
MENNPEQEECLLNHSQNTRKGGLKTIPFIIVNEACERLASYGLLPNLIIYITTFYHMEAARASILITLWSALSNGLAILGAFISDSYLGRYRAVAIGTISSLIGMIVLWLSTIIPQLRPLPCGPYQLDCNATTAAQLAVILCSFGLISIGAGFVRPCSIAFGADQLENKENPDNERLMDSYFNWFYASVGVAIVLAVTVIVYIQDHFGWQVGFGVPALLMVLAVSVFLIGSPLYKKAKPKGSLFTGLFQVAVAAFRKRHINVQLNYNDDCYYRAPESKLIEPSTDFRCLNRACIIQDPHMELKPDGKASDPWSLCSVEQVELMKCVFRVLPIWSTSLMLLVSMSQSYLIFQLMTVDRHVFPQFEIPAGSVSMITLIALTIWVAFYDRALVPLLSRYTGQPTGLSTVSRMGIGLFLGIVASALSAITETIRCNKAIDAGFEDDPNGVINMSFMWFAPQLALYGVAEALNVVGQIEFIYSLFPKTMSSFAAALYTFGLAVASLISSLLVSVVDSVTSSGGNTSWLATNINRGHLDYFYWLTTFLCLINFLFYLIVCRFTEHHHDGNSCLFPEAEEEHSKNKRFHGA